MDASKREAAANPAEEDEEAGLLRGPQASTQTSAAQGRCLRLRFCSALLLLAVVAALAALAALAFAAQTSSSASAIAAASALPPASEEFLQVFAQHRPEQLVGTDSRYSVQNHDVNGHLRRQQQRFDAIQLLRAGHCGRFPDFLRGASDTNWAALPEAHWRPEKGAPQPHEVFQYCDRFFAGCVEVNVTRSVCHAPHPTIEDGVVTIERLGPWTMRGVYDWVRVAGYDVGGLQARYFNRSFTIFGGMFAPTRADGTIIGYPPVHIHHAHLFAYGDILERSAKSIGSRADQIDVHHVVVQTHGDSECKPEEGGMSCLYRELDHPETEGYLVHQDQSGLSMDFELNNMLDEQLEGVYVDAVVVHRDRVPARPVTYFHIGNGLVGDGPATYDIPADPSSTVMWHAVSMRFAGTLRDFHVHTHQTMFDSMFVFKGGNALKALEPYRNGRLLPLVLDCESQWNGSLAQAKSALLSVVTAADGVELVCEVTKPSVLLQNCSGPVGDPFCAAFDKRVAANCLKSIHVDIGEEMVVLAFNHARNLSTVTRHSETFIKNLESYDYALKQHSVFRANMVHDAPVDLAYAPPAYYEYAWTPLDVKVPHSPHNDIVAGCPARISFNMSISFEEWLHIVSGGQA